jgi:transcription elongation factor GreA
MYAEIFLLFFVRELTIMNMTKDFYLTKGGVKELEAELEELKKQRFEVADKLKAAKEQGDLSENSDWSSAQDEFKFVDGRISEIEHILQNVTIITNNTQHKQVSLCAKVTLQAPGKKTSTYILVGSLEAQPDEGKISDESPVGRALLGKSIGDSVDISVPSGETTSYKLISIS